MACAIYGLKVKNGKNIRTPIQISLHNDVDIKIGIIYKNRKNRQKCLQLQRFWSIVFMQSEYLCISAPFLNAVFPLLSFCNFIAVQRGYL